LNYKLCLVIVTFSIVITSVASSSICKHNYMFTDEEPSDNLFFDFCYCNSSAYAEDIGNYLGKVQITNDESYINSALFENGNECEPDLGGLIDSPWPMKGHDLHHTGRSPYSTAYNNGEEFWYFNVSDGWINGGVVVDDDGTIYFGCENYYLYAIRSDGALKWRFRAGDWIWSTPAIADDGTIYIGTYDNYLYAINPNGTLKWNFYARGSISSSPAIAKDGTIYFGTMKGLDKGDIFAINPDGTEKWHYETSYYIVSDPAIGIDGTVYVGSGDTYLYALRPDGTLRWRFKTGDWVKAHPSIADDGTIYISSFDGYLYAIHPDGTLKWKYSGGGDEASASIDKDGTIYVGNTYLHAIYPNGTLRWKIDVGPNIDHASPAIGVEGTIYVGAGVYIIAINPDGTERWRRTIANSEVLSSPCIEKNGIVYIGSYSQVLGYNYGRLYAFGYGEINAFSNGPYYALVNQAVGFKGEVTGGNQPYTWHWDFGDESTSDEQNPLHFYAEPGNYTITLTVTDNEGNSSTDITWAWIQETNNPPNKPTIIGDKKGKVDNYYLYSFSADDPENNAVYYQVEWGDGLSSGWKGPYKSGEQINLSHSWDEQGNYNIRAKARDVYGSEGDWATLRVSMPKSKPFNPLWQLLERLIERFPIMEHLFHFIE